MRYELLTDKLVNRLVPHYLSGRRYILFLQSLVWPLKTLNDRFQAFAYEKHIEARMTSQVLYFEWYLNYKFGKYLEDSRDRIFIQDSHSIGVDLYHEGASVNRPCTIWYNGEEITSDQAEEQPRPFYLNAEEKLINRESFMVCVPPVRINTQEFVYMLSYAVNAYRIAGKTYLIKIDQQEIEPNKITK